MAAVDAIPPGWSVSDKYREILAKLPDTSDILTHLLNADMREFGTAWIDSKKGKDSLDADGQILQIVRVRNIAISQAEEDFQFLAATAPGGGGGSRLLRLTLTDGKTNISALDVDNSPKLSSETPPGTKIRLNGRVPLKGGFLILKRNNFEVLESNVDSLRQEWLLTRGAKGTHRSNRGGADDPPPFVAFGTPEASAMIASHNQFLNSLRNRNQRSEDKFDSLKLAMNATSKATAAPGGDDSDFQQKRREVLAEAQNIDAGQTQHRFKRGGSKFQQARVDMTIERDRNLAQLVAMGYQPNEASTALEGSKNSLEGAIDRLTSRQINNGLDIRRRGGGGKPDGDHGRGRGRGRGGTDGGKSNSILEDSPFGPADEKSGLNGKPSQGPVPLSELMDRPLPKQANGPSAGPSSSYYRPPAEPREPRLPVGTALQARVMSGDYEVAELVGLLSSKVDGEPVAVVKYLASGEQEQVPVNMLRTMDNAKITANMLPEIPSLTRGNAELNRDGRGFGGGFGGNARRGGGGFAGGRGGPPQGSSRGRGGGGVGRGRGGGFTRSGPRGRAPRRRGGLGY
ncbi:hypothetical protein Aperf_G00000075461 [Anoplocephala perfoliata]